MLLKSSPLARNIARPQFDYLNFGFGLDTTTSIINTVPGSLRSSQNYEININGGYSWIDGYELYDGQPKPSAAIVNVIDVTITGALAADDVVTGGTSGATGTVLFVNTTYDEDQTHIVLTKITGTFVTGETLEVSAVAQATTDGGPSTSGPIAKLVAQYANYAADLYRADIAAVPGNGNILGIWMLNDVDYAFRNNAGDTAVDIYKSSASGWTKITNLGFEMNFTSGGANFASGTVTLSGSSGTLDGITVDSIQLLDSVVTFTDNLTNTAALAAEAINANTTIPNYTATSAGAVITITADDAGTTPNGYVVTSATTTLGSVDVNLSGGATVTAIAEGDTVTGETSTETAVVARVMLESGSWAAGTAAGKLIFTATPSGAFTAAETLKVSTDLNKCTVTASYSAITMLPGGRFEFVTHNFGGEAGAERIYGVDGVNRGFEFDGTVFCPIDTGMTTDTPTHVGKFNNHLFFSYAGSAQHSGLGSPYAWDPIFGAAELTIGDTITAFKEQPGAQGNGTLTIFARNKIYVLYGTSILDWNLVRYRDEVGAYEYSVQEFGMTIMLDDRGIASLSTAQEHGNFQSNSLSVLIQAWINERKATITASTIVREKSQYRLFFSDGSGLFITFKNRKVAGFMPVLFDHPVRCCYSLETSAGVERILYGAADGKVFEMDKGTSFDGDPIERYIIVHYHHSKSPRIIKRYLDATMEIAGAGYAEFDFSYELQYTDYIETPQPAPKTLVANYGEVIWDVFTWDNFYWDGRILTPTKAKLHGSAENISFIIRSTSDYFNKLNFSGIQIQQNVRRHMR